MPQNPFSKKSALAQVMIVAIKFYINKKRQAYVYLKVKYFGKNLHNLRHDNKANKSKRCYHMMRHKDIYK